MLSMNFHKTETKQLFHSRYFVCIFHVSMRTNEEKNNKKNGK